MIGAFVQWGPGHYDTTGYVIAENGCHVWVGSLERLGYAQVIEGGRLQMAHRIRYEREIGPIPEGLVLDHFVCNNRACCNPLHVRPVTQRENTLRSENSISAVNAARTHCKNGHPLTGIRGRRLCRTCINAAARLRYAQTPPNERRVQIRRKVPVEARNG